MQSLCTITTFNLAPAPPPPPPEPSSINDDQISDNVTLWLVKARKAEKVSIFCALMREHFIVA